LPVQGIAVDTHSIIMPLPEPEALRRIVHQVLSGGDAVLALDGGALALLDEVAAELAQSRCRVLRVSAQAAGGLSLSGVMAQITGRPDLDAHDDEVLERGFQALTVLDPECDQIVLLVSGAEALQRTALRYLQFTCRAVAALRLVLAGDQGPPDMLEEDEMAFLRTRMAASPMIRVASLPVAALPAAAVAAAAQPVPLPPSKPQFVPSGPAPAGLAPHGQAPAGARLPALFEAMSSLPLSGPAQAVPLRSEPHVALPPANTAWRRSRAAWIGLGMAASVAAGVLIGRQGWPAEPAALSQPAPEVVQPPVPVPVQAAPAAAALQRPGTQPQAAMPDRPAEQGKVAAPAPSALHALPALLASPVVPAPSAMLAPSAMPPSDHAAYPPAAAGRPDTPATRPPAPPADAGQAPAALADAAPSRPRPAAPARPAEARFREPSVPAQGAPPIRAARRATETPDARVPDTRPIEPRERAAAGRREPFRAPPSHAPLVAAAPEWPSVPTAPWARTGEERSVIGTYTTDQNGVRTFRSTQ